jgi:glycosyltransferase involved in cell wall biosynthesis
MKVCLIGPDPNDVGGVAKSMRYLTHIYKILGYDCVWLSSRNVSFALLRECSIIHVHGPLGTLTMLKMLLLRKAKKVLTLHGWVLDEAKVKVLTAQHLLEKMRLLLAYYLFVVLNWILHKLLFIPFLYDYVTAVSRITAKKNGVKALITPNPAPCKNAPFHKDNRANQTPNRSNKDEIVFVTYVSIGGGKILSIPRLIKIVHLSNQRLRDLGINKRVILYIYGKDVPQHIIERLSKIPYVRFMGYVKDYPERVKEADLFLAGYSFPELGHAVLEAICAGVPIAKFTEDPSQEEIIDGFNGILAFNDEEMLEKLTKYIIDMDNLKKTFAINAENTILRKRSLKYIAVMWKVIIENLMKN